jgi:hypothetical protein
VFAADSRFTGSEPGDIFLLKFFAVAGLLLSGASSAFAGIEVALTFDQAPNVFSSVN